MSETESTAKKIRPIRHQNCQKYSAEEKIRIVLEGLRGDESIAPTDQQDTVNCAVGKALHSRCITNPLKGTSVVERISGGGETATGGALAAAGQSFRSERTPPRKQPVAGIGR